MKLTLAFLAALAAADAAESRSHRQARRQYGYGSPVGGSYGDVSSAAKPAETPSPSSVAVVSSAAEVPAVSSVVDVPYVQTSAAAFETSSPPNAASSYAAVEGTPSPVATPEVPAGGMSSILVPVEAPKASSPAAGGDYGAGNPVPSLTKTPLGAVPSGVYPSGGQAVPGSSLPVEAASSVVVPSGGYPVPASSSVLVEATPSGVYGPTGTGVVPSGASNTPMSDYVTKTIYSTSVYSASNSMVTSVVAVGTTCIPKDEADKTPSPSAPAMITSKIPVSEVVKTMTETLVYTVGVGSTAHPVTTKITSTSTSTIFSTVVVTPSVPEKSVYPEGGNVGTSTIKSTTTSTKYITVRPTPSGNATPSGNVPSNKEGYPVGAAGSPSGPAGGAGEDCAVPVTVTTTLKETVYITAPSMATATPASGIPSKPEGDYPANQPEVPAGGAGKPTPSGNGKYPMINGTNPYPAGPTGFQTFTKPAASETSLPAFSFASDVAVSTPAASKTPSVESGAPYMPASSAAPAYTPPAGGEYGAQPPKPAETPVVSSKVPSNGQAYPTPTPAGNGYGSGYGTY